MTARTQSRPAALALGHAGLLAEVALFHTRRLGLVSRSSAADDVLGPLVISDEDVRTVLASLRALREPGAPVVEQPYAEALAASRDALAAALAEPAARELGLARIAAAFELSAIELDALVLALAPDWDPRFGRLFGFLNNDATRERPTVGQLELALDADEAPLDRLLEHGLVALERAPLVARPALTVLAPAAIVAISLRPVVAAAPAAPDAAAWERVQLAAPAKAALRAGLGQELRGDGRVLALLEGAPGAGRAACVQAAAAEAGIALVECDLPATRRRRRRPPADELGEAWMRASLTGAALLLRSDGALGDDEAARGRLAGLVETRPLRCFVLTRPDELAGPDAELTFVRIDVPHPDAAARRRIWLEQLARCELAADDALVAEAADRYDLAPGRIAGVVDELAARAPERDGAAFTLADATTALRRLTTRRMADLATPFESELTLDDLVLPAGVRERLDEVVDRMRHRFTVMSDWRFGAQDARGAGVSALFSGPPGTGKTAAAAAIASAVDLTLYVVNVSAIMSKWVGETEKNLARVFGEAEAASVALLFDEADSVFGKRSSDVRSANDRFANVTINYLLQRMETYTGLAILTTNLESAMDTAFSRRITTRINFPAPDEEQRRELWRRLLPACASFADDVDLDALARGYKLPGARVKRALQRAAFRAAAAGRAAPVFTQEDLVWAANSEYQDMGLLRGVGTAEAPRSRQRFA